MKEIDVKGITYLPSYHKMIMSIPDPELRLKAFEAVTNYMMTGEEPECDDWQIKIIMEGVRPVIDKSRRKSKNAQSDDEEETNEKQAENKTKTNEKQIENKSKTNGKQTENKRETDKDKDKDKDKDNRKRKRKYGEYSRVSLTDDELNRLNSEYGEELTQKAIKRLDEYIQETGKSYKDHNLTLRRWVFNAVNEDEAKNRASPDDVRDWREDL